MKFSILIPSYNRAPTLRRVLAAYDRQQGIADVDLELVVVDDGSEDGTTELLAGWQPQNYTLSHAVQANQGPAAARNRALHIASGELVMFTGDDIEPTPSLLAEHLAAHRAWDDPLLAVVGLTRWADDQTLTATMRHIDGPGAQQFSYHFFEDGSEYDFRHFYTSNLTVYRALLDREPSYFSTDFPAAAFEDAELAYRLTRHGLRIRYRAAAEALHHHPYRASDFYRRQRRCGEMAAILWRKCPELRKYLQLDRVEQLRLRLLHARLGGQSEPNGNDLACWRDRALRLADFFDPLPFAAVDTLLRPLFEVGFVAGLAAALYPRPTAERLVTTLFFDLVPSAAADLRQQLRAAGQPHPRADLDALCQLQAA